MPAAAKSNALMGRTPDSSEDLTTVVSRVGGVEVLFPKMDMPDGFGLLWSPTVLGGLLAPTVNGNGLCLGFAGSNPNENGLVNLEESSKLGSDETGSALTRLYNPAAAELGKIEVALDVMTKVGRVLAIIVRTFALMSSSLASLDCTFFVCSCGFVGPPGERSVGLQEKLKLEDGGSNLNSDFGRPGEGTGNAAALAAGEDGTEAPSGWKLNLNLLGSFGAELNLLRGAVGLMLLVGLVEVPVVDDPLSLIGMVSFGCSFVFSICSGASMSMSSNTSIIISGSGAAI